MTSIPECKPPDTHPPGRQHRFVLFAKHTAHAAGHPAAFVAASVLILAWLITGPIFHYSDTWQLVINTGTTIITFLMVFLIQNTQNRDSIVIHLKLDELIRAIKGAQNSMLDMEHLDDDELEKMRVEYEKLAEKARNTLESRETEEA